MSDLMHDVNSNLVATQWGLISVFGVVVTLLIAPTDRYLQQFLSSGTDVDRGRAALWAASLRVTSCLVLLLLSALSVLGAMDAGLRFTGRPSIGSWLLVTPLLAQGGFVALVECLVGRVPPIESLPLQQPPDMERSPGGQRRPTVIRFVNNTSVEICYRWIDFEGQLDERGAIPVDRASGTTQPTFEGHRFVVATKSGHDLGTVVASENPGRVTIEPRLLPTAVATRLAHERPTDLRGPARC